MTPRFIKISSPQPLVKYLADTIGTHLRAGERVLWEVSGGSAVAVEVEVAAALGGTPLEHLTVTLTDERPGPVGHPDSNWFQLARAGFKLPGARLLPVLTGSDIAADTAAFADVLAHELAAGGYHLGLFGIGPDGHTAGLPAQNAPDHVELAAYYEAGDFRRISSTPAAIARLDEAVVYAVGESKHPQLERLSQQLPYTEQSAQALKQAPSLAIFNDYKGETL
ncbi:MAG TPA: 6-phosphogluconolactonase [Candidatus Saccharimonadia bacterium]|jgi:6-phosphogluconolactonase/glucosamine-6-phosphate isomerase/deaminase